MKNRVIKILATGGYVGLSPRAPGTLGTLWGVPLAWGVSLLEPTQSVIIIALLSIAAIIIAGLEEKAMKVKDPSSIICDEVVGFLIAMIFLPFTLVNVVAAFILFRFFDILKPFPIGYVDKKLKGGTGIVVDDLIAGLFANIIIRLALSFWSQV